MSAINSCVLLNPWPPLRGSPTRSMAVGEKPGHASVHLLSGLSLQPYFSPGLIFRVDVIFWLFCQHYKLQRGLGSLHSLSFTAESWRLFNSFLPCRLNQLPNLDISTTSCLFFPHATATALTPNPVLFAAAVAVAPHVLFSLIFPALNLIPLWLSSVEKQSSSSGHSPSTSLGTGTALAIISVWHTSFLCHGSTLFPDLPT